jgi:DNA polymerase iota
MSAMKIRMSAGIATSQIMAKLISGLHKPNDQTILLPEFTKDFLKDLPVRVIPGVGSVLSQKLAARSIVKVSDIWSWSEERLIEAFGEKQGKFVHKASQGIDHANIDAESGGFMEPKTISLEDSMRICSGFSESKLLLQKLAPDLVYRIHGHFQKFGKIPTTLTVTYRMKEAGMHERHACSTAIPKRINSTSMVESGMEVLRTKLQEPFHLSLLNIAAKNFVPASPDSIDLDTSHHNGSIKSKREIRMNREIINSVQNDDNEDASFWRDLNEVDGNRGGQSKVKKKRAPSHLPLSDQRKKITSFFQKK